MREPLCRWPARGVVDATPYSQASSDILRQAADGSGDFDNAFGEEFYDPDFRRRYAAILLRERGL